MSDEISPIRILVVDDHPVVRAGIQSLVTGHANLTELQKGPAADSTSHEPVVNAFQALSRVAEDPKHDMSPPEVWATKEKQWRDHTHYTARQDAEMGISI